MFKLVSDRSTNGRDMRLAVVQTIQDLMKTNDKIVALEADLGGASKFTDIQKPTLIVLYNVDCRSRYDWYRIGIIG